MRTTTILIIDDEEHVRMLYAEELKQLGYHVVLADGAEEPKELLATHAPDGVILDIRLGNTRSGLDVLQQLRCAGATQPIILCTAYDSFRYDLKSIAADAYVVKSYDSTELITTVKRLVPVHKMQR